MVAVAVPDPRQIPARKSPAKMPFSEIAPARYLSVVLVGHCSATNGASTANFIEPIDFCEIFREASLPSPQTLQKKMLKYNKTNPFIPRWGIRVRGPFYQVARHLWHSPERSRRVGSSHCENPRFKSWRRGNLSSLRRDCHTLTSSRFAMTAPGHFTSKQSPNNLLAKPHNVRVDCFKLAQVNYCYAISYTISRRWHISCYSL